MPADLVVDASAIARLFQDDDGSDAFREWYTTRRREGDRFHAPSILPYELANILHRQRGDTDDASDPDFAMNVIRDAMQGIVLDDLAWARTWRWAARLTAYDAAYLGLAMVKEAALVTYDRVLIEAAREHVLVFGLDGLD